MSQRKSKLRNINYKMRFDLSTKTHNSAVVSSVKRDESSAKLSVDKHSYRNYNNIERNLNREFK